MGMIFWILFKHVIAKYVFVDRKKMPYIPGIIERIRAQVQMVSELPAHIDRAHYVKRRWPWMNWLYLLWYSNHKFDPKQVQIWEKDGQVHIEITGPVYEITYWEIFLLRIYSTLYTEMSGRLPKPNYADEAEGKSRFMFEHGILWVEGGGRRSFSPEVHWEVLARAAKYPNQGAGGLLGTSWIEYAFQLDLMQFGTQAHEFTAFMGAFFDHIVANKMAMQIWVETYGTRLGYVLPDCYGLEDFEKAFSYGYADLFTGMRHDSGPAIEFVDWALRVYRKDLIQIDPVGKNIIHSDSIKSLDEADLLNQYKRGQYNRSFLIGGYMTNDVGWGTYNTVIKLWSVEKDGMESFAVKVPDQISKAVGDPDTITRVLKQQGRS